jgi:signal peptide peptidase SppA
MKILDILNRPWAILDTKLQSMQDVYERHAAGEKFDVEGLKAALGERTDNSGGDSGYTVDNGVAIVPIEGVLSKRMNLMSYFSGGTSTQELQQTLDAVAKDPAVHSAILSIDSPGGEVDGTQLAANAIAQLNKTKQVIAFVDGQADSGAYWLASQASKIFMADDTTEVGSIGVVVTHVDRSKANEMAGRKVTEVTAGKYKRVASTHNPLTPDGHQALQNQVDPIYTVFIDDVAEGRGVSVDTVLADMAEGRIFIGQQAIDAGLVDGVSSIAAIVAQLNEDFQQQQQNPGATRPANRIPGANSMFKTFATEAEYTAALSAEFERGKASVSTLSDADLTRIKGEAATAAATAERERIQAVEAQALPGHSALIASLKFDGKATGHDAAVAVLAAERKLRGTTAQSLEEDAPKPVGASVPDPKKEAEEKAAREAAAAGAVEEDPAKAAVKLSAYVAEQAKAGRKISLAQASAEINKK